MTSTLRAMFGSALAAAALAAVLAGCDGSGFTDDSGYGSTGSEDDSGSVVFSDDGDSLTTLPGGEISFSGSDGSSFSTGD